MAIKSQLVNEIQLFDPDPNEPGEKEFGIVHTKCPSWGKIDQNGQWRRKGGTLIKGTPKGNGLNPNAPPKAKQVRLDAFDRFVTGECGEDMNLLLSKIVQIAMYDPNIIENPDIITDIDPKNSKPKVKKHFYNAKNQMEAIKLLMAYYFGKPKESKVIEGTVDVKVEEKITNITKLITQNADRLTLEHPTQEDIQDADFTDS
jgi:hypothetical protein